MDETGPRNQQKTEMLGEKCEGYRTSFQALKYRLTPDPPLARSDHVVLP